MRFSWPIKRQIKAFSLGKSFWVQSTSGKEVGIIGASVMAIEYVLDAETIDQMVSK
jgi:hypothetical protein